MLLEYNADTDETTLHERAITLRQRVASRKLQELGDAGLLSTDYAIRLKEDSRQQQKLHAQESIEITAAEVHDRIALTRANQHLLAEGQVRSLGSDVTRAARLGKAKLDSLNDLEKRIIGMRIKLQSSVNKTVENEIVEDLKVNAKQLKLEKEFKNCIHCHRRILVQMIEVHENICPKKQASTEEAEQKIARRALFEKTVDDVNKNVVTSLSTFHPQPPRNCRVVGKGVSFIKWDWDPPVVDGGLEVTEYELSYKAKMSEFDEKIGRYRKWEEDTPSLKTSNFVFRGDPVCHNGYKMTYLRAGTEYTNFKIRCYNLRGWSDWVPMLTNLDDKVTTDPAQPATPPLFAVMTKVSSSCIHLAWQPPFFDGGLPIIDYSIYYTYLEKQITVTHRDVIIEHARCFNVENAQSTEAVIRNLPDNTEVINIFICALNSGNIVGQKAVIKPASIFTNPSSRYSKIARELDITSNATEEFIDTAFFTGVKQRLNRIEHMRQLQAELSITPPEPEEQEEAKEWAAVKERKRLRQKQEEEVVKQQQMLVELSMHKRKEEAEEDQLEGRSRLDNPFQFTYQQRRNHYQIKIAKLEQQMQQLQQERQNIDKLRISQTLTMRSKEQRLCALNLENERLKHYHSPVITSDALTGAEMQYNTVDYRIRIEKELQKVIQDIANLKYSIITNENRRQEIKKKVVQLEENHKERMANAKDFETNYQKTMRVLSRLNKSGHDHDRIMLLYFRRLQLHKQQRYHLRNKIINMFSHLMLRYKKSAFNRWRIGKFTIDAHDTTEMVGIGDVMLSQSLEKRLELQDQLRFVMTNTVAIQQQLSLISLPKSQKQGLVTSKYFKQMSEGYDVTEQYHQGLTLLYEGNGYAKENKFDLAQHCYEAQIILLRAKRPVNIKLLAVNHNKQGNMFLALNKANRALIEFDRQLSLAKEICDLCEECDAYAGLGKGYLMNYDYENAIRYLSIAQAQYLTLGRYLPYFNTLQALKTCYEKLNKADKVAIFQKKLEEMADNVGTRITNIHSRLDNYTNRLAYTAADIELVVQIERITLKALEVRGQINSLNDELKEIEAQYTAQEKVIEQIQFLMTEIKNELEQAIQSDELEMYSALVHDQPQVVEIEELKTRLRQRGQQEFDKLVIEQQVLHRLEVKRKNTENSIADFDYQFNLEQGELMRHQVLSRSFRCIALCSTNAAGNEVTGTATGGYEEFAACEGNRIHLIDYHNGELVHIFAGKDKTDNCHQGLITCLLHDGHHIFSGGTDEKIFCWSTVDRNYVRTFLGHEGSIVALAAETKFLLSSSADVTMRLWNKHTGQQLRVVFGHSKSVLTMEVGPSWMISGSTDTEVRIWRITHTKKSYSVESAQRLQGHTAPVTCVKYGNVEVVSGDFKGNIYIWWLKTGSVLRTCAVHKGPVKAIQFDSVHIVSGGVDKTVCVTDIATGEVLQSLRGHTGPVLALAFDTERILSVGGDSTIRYWQWGKRTAPQDKHHVMEQGETLVSIAKKYNITLEQLMRWNGVLEMKKIHTGMKLIVKKGDPNKPTDVEKAAQEREQRLANSRTVTNKKLSKLQGKSLLNSEKYNSRVQKIAMDIDTFSLGNRLFGQETKDLELFPVEDAFEDKYSLAYRLKYDMYHHNDATSIDKVKKDRTFVYLAEGNEDEWGEVADQLGQTMLHFMVELMVYELVLEQKKRLRDKNSVIGRIFKYEQEKQLLLTNGAPALPSIEGVGGSRRPSAKIAQDERTDDKVAIHHDAGEESAEIQEALQDLFSNVSMHTIEEEREEDLEASGKVVSLPPINMKHM